MIHQILIASIAEKLINLIIFNLYTFSERKKISNLDEKRQEKINTLSFTNSVFKYG